MTDQNLDVKPNLDTNQEGEPTSKSTVKTFTQEQLDAIIDARLKREKLQQSQNLDEVKAETQRLSEAAEAKDAMLSKYEEILKGIVKKQLKDLPKPMRELVEKLDPAEQLVWLETNADNLEEMSVPKKTVNAVPSGTEVKGEDIEKIIESKQGRYGPYGPTV